MMKTYFLYQDKKHEYTLTWKEDDHVTVITLYRSHNSDWNDNAQGEKVCSLIDDGNNVKISKMAKKLDYSDADALRIMLNFNNHLSHMPSHYEVIDAKQIVTV